MPKNSKFSVLFALVMIAFSASLRAEFVYVSCGSTLLSYALNNKTGALSPLPNLPITGGVGPMVLAASGKSLYANTGSPSVISGYRIQPNGSLAPLPGSPFSAAGGSFGIDPLGRYLYVTGGTVLAAGASTVSAYQIGATGALTPVPGSPFASGTYPISVTVDPFGRFVYVANFGSKNISAYRILENGTLMPVPGSPFAIQGFGQPITLAVEPSGRFLYAANFGAANISSYRIGPNGALAPLAGSPTPVGGAFYQAMTLDPVGGFLEVLEGESGLVSFHINNTTGILESEPEIVTGNDPFALAVDPLGKFVYVANANRTPNIGPISLSGYQIGPKGALKTVPGSPFVPSVPTGSFPTSVVIAR